MDTASLLPYPLNRNKDSLYYFATAAGVLYFCGALDKTASLPPMLGIYDIQVLEFEFFPFLLDGVEQGEPDERIAPTIIAALRRVFITSEVVVFFLCDATDRKHRGRQRLFRNWHAAYMGKDFTRLPVELTIETERGDIQQVFGCILFRADFPHGDVLQRELINKVAEIFGEKFL